jgi:SAM-dependent methyltransferase
MMRKKPVEGRLYFNELAYSTRKYIIPYINEYYPISDNMSILEIGCGAGENLQPFLELGCKITGVDLIRSRINDAHLMLDTEHNKEVRLLCDDVFNISGLGKFDIIFVRDFIEHLSDKQRFFSFIKDFLKENGVIYFTFPAWHMPFGGHQQICQNELLVHLPFYHLLSKSMYKRILYFFKEDKRTVEKLMSIRDCRITVEQFHQYAENNGYTIFQETLFLTDSRYVKSKSKPRKLNSFIAKIPLIRNFFATTCYYLLKHKQG